MSEFNHKNVLVTGSASGIGFGIASAFAQQGANLILTDIVQDNLTKAAKTLRQKYPIQVLTLMANGSDEQAVKTTIEKVINEWDSLHVLINNAQASKSGLTLIEHSKSDFALAIDSGLYATFYYMKYAFPHLKEVQGSVINLASGAALQGKSGQASYAAAKEGIRGLSRVAATEWGEYGINVNVICPLAMTDTLIKWKEKFPDMFQKNINDIPLKRFGDPQQDIGQVCVFLASKAASYITGETLSVQGGAGLRP